MQLEDDTLEVVRESASKAGIYWFYEDGLRYRPWHPQEEGEEFSIEQQIVPKQREAVLKLAPLAGHLGKSKAVEPILQRFYWATYRVVAEWCRTCEQCQKESSSTLSSTTSDRGAIYEDCHGPLPQSSAGNKYLLVVCDYATHYPETIPMKTVDAEHGAE